MKHCPNCHCEYEEWATICSDCAVALEAGPAPAPPEPPPVLDYGQFRDWVVVTNVPNTMLGNLLKDQLQHAGIPVLMKRSRATDIAEWSHNDFAWQDLYVPRRFAARARRLIDSPPGRRYADDAVVEDDWEDEEDELVYEEELAAGDLAGPPARNLQSDWYLIDSARPAPPTLPPAIPPTTAPVAATSGPVPLPSLSRYRLTMARRKDHLPPPPGDRRVVPFPGAAPAPVPFDDADDDDPDEGYSTRSTGATWTHSRIYRILLGLLFLAWTLPFLLQMLQYFGDAFGQLFR